MLGKDRLFRVAWDCDGVLAESHRPVLNEANVQLSHILGRNIELTKSDLTSWRALRQHVLDLTKSEQIASEIDNIWFDPDILRLSRPNYAALEVFNRLHQSGIEQFVVTTRLPNCRQSTLDFLNEYLPNLDWSQNLFIRDLDNPDSGNEFKRKCLQKLNITHMFEDSPDTITYLMANLPECRFTYFTQPWNSSDQHPDRDKLRVNFNDTEAIYRHLFQD